MREKTACVNQRRYTLAPWAVLLSRPGACVSEHRIISAATGATALSSDPIWRPISNGKSLYRSRLIVTDGRTISPLSQYREIRKERQAERMVRGVLRGRIGAATRVTAQEVAFI